MRTLLFAERMNGLRGNNARNSILVTPFKGHSKYECGWNRRRAAETRRNNKINSFVFFSHFCGPSSALEKGIEPAALPIMRHSFTSPANNFQHCYEGRRTARSSAGHFLDERVDASEKRIGTAECGAHSIWANICHFLCAAGIK